MKSVALLVSKEYFKTTQIRYIYMYHCLMNEPDATRKILPATDRTVFNTTGPGQLYDKLRTLTC